MTTIKFLLAHSEAKLPQYQDVGCSGMDVRSVEDLVLEPGGIEIVKTGLKPVIPVGLEIQVRSRSGMAAKHGVAVLNSPGTIDASYRGEIGVILINHGPAPYTIRVGDRIAQLVVAKVEMVQVEATDSLPETTRGEGGFGSTGTK